jgi:PAS domain S-box-containing protein
LHRIDPVWKGVADRLARPCFLIDRDGSTLYASGSARRLLEIEDPQEVSAHIARLLSVDEDLWPEGWLDVVFDRGEAIWLELPRQVEPCSWWELTLIPISGRDGVVVAGLGIVRDVSRRKRAESRLRESEKLYRTVVETSPDSITLADLEGNFLAVNLQTATMYGCENTEQFLAEAPNALDHIIEEDREEGRRAMREALETGAVRGRRFRVHRRDGSTYWAEASSSTLTDEQGAPTGFVTVLRDISEQRRAEVEAETRNLELQVANEELARANEELESLHRAKDELIAVISHELRSPLVTGLGYVDLLLQGDLGPISTKARRRMSVARASLQRLSALVDDILEFQRVGRETFRETVRPHPCDLGKICRECVADFLVRSKGGSTSLTMEIAPDLPDVMVDGDRIRQVLINLLDNAATHAGKDAKIKVRLQRDGHDVLVAVSDDGRGMPEEVQKKAFQPFVQGGDDASGTGLGLSIVQRILEAHSSHPTLESRSGQGTTVSFPLPVAGESEQEQAPADYARTRKDAGAGRRVLVVDDDADTVEFLELVLQSRGFEVASASSGDGALELIAKQRVDGAIVDFTLPGMDGLELASRLRRSSSFGDLPVMMLTARSEQGVKERAEEVGCDRFMHKPVITEQLIDALVELFGAGSREGLAELESELDDQGTVTPAH